MSNGSKEREAVQEAKKVLDDVIERIDQAAINLHNVARSLADDLSEKATDLKRRRRELDDSQSER